MKIYLAGQISGSSYDKVVSRIEEKKKLLPAYRVLSPMTGKGCLRTEAKFKVHGYDNPVSTNHAIFERDKWMISQCDVVLVDLLETVHVSIGCTMELAWASLLGKHTIVVMGIENPHHHAFVLEAADIIFETMDEAIIYLNKLVGGDV